jgi:xylan 1,4-beta-xylosidase
MVERRYLTCSLVCHDFHFPNLLLIINTGKAAPAGRLPVTQYPAAYVNEIAMTNMSLRASPGRTYRWYTGDAVVPIGFGLHYTNFSTSFTSANSTSYSISSLISKCTTAYLDQCPLTDIQVQVTNTGSVTSDYVTLLFLHSSTGPTPYPIKTLVSYDRVCSVAAKGSRMANLPLTLGSIERVNSNGSTVLYPGMYRLGVDIAPKSYLEFTLTGSEIVLEQWPQD